MFNKKAESEMPLWAIFKILIIVLIGGVVFFNTHKVSTAETYTLKSLVVDLSLEIDAVQTLREDSNGFIVFPFPFEVDVEIDNNKVSLSRNNVGAEYFFVRNKDINIPKAEIFNTASIYIINDGGTIHFSNKPEFFNNFYSCPDLELNLKKISIDPGKGYDMIDNKGNRGMIIDGKSESIYTLDIASLISSNKFFDITRKSGKEVRDSFLSIKDRKDKVADALISIHVGDFKNLVKAYVNPEKESVVLACNILNELKKELKFENSAIIPVNFDLISEDNYKQILNIDKPAVLLEFGSDIIKEKKHIAEFIIKGVQNV